MSGITYKQSGVDIKKANHFVSWIVDRAKKTKNKGAIDAGVSFGSLFEIGRGYH